VQGAGGTLRHFAATQRAAGAPTAAAVSRRFESALGNSGVPRLNAHFDLGAPLLCVGFQALAGPASAWIR
jgi:hypothetical protein